MKITINETDHVIDTRFLKFTIKSIVENVESFDIAKAMISYRENNDIEFIKCDFEDLDLDFDHIAISNTSIYLICDNNKSFTEYRFECVNDLLMLYNELEENDQNYETSFLSVLINVVNNCVNSKDEMTLDNLTIAKQFKAHVIQNKKAFDKQKLINEIKDRVKHYCESIDYIAKFDHYSVLQSIIDIAITRCEQTFERDELKELQEIIFREMFKEYTK